MCEETTDTIVYRYTFILIREHEEVFLPTVGLFNIVK